MKVVYVLILTLFPLLFAYAQDPSPQPLRKTSKNVDRLLEVRLDGYSKNDLISLIPKREQLEVTVGSVKNPKTRDSFNDINKPTNALALEPGQNIADSLLQVTEKLVTFTRPASTDDRVYVCISFPESVQVKLIVNGEQILQSSLREPLIFRNEAFERGPANPISIPHITARPKARITILEKGQAFIRAEELKIKNITPLKASSSKSKVVFLRLEIDKAGRVSKAEQIAGEIVENLSDVTKEWEFEPHKVKGSPSDIVTIFKVTVQ